MKKNNKTIALNVLYIPCNTRTIGVAYRSEHNNKHKKQVNLLMVSNGKKQHYLPAYNLSALFERNSSNHHDDFFIV